MVKNFLRFLRAINWHSYRNKKKSKEKSINKSGKEIRNNKDQ